MSNSLVLILVRNEPLESIRLMNPPLRLLSAFQEHETHSPEVLLQVPGREMWVAATLGANHRYTIYSPDIQGHTSFDRRSAKQKRTVRGRPLPRWSRFAAGVILVMAEDDLLLSGGTIVLVGDEPSGPRYEHALGMGIAALCYEQNERDYDVQDLLNIMERVQKSYFANETA